MIIKLMIILFFFNLQLNPRVYEILQQMSKINRIKAPLILKTFDCTKNLIFVLLLHTFETLLSMTEEKSVVLNL